MTVMEQRREGRAVEKVRPRMGADRKGKYFIVLVNLEFSQKKNQQHYYSFQGMNFFLETEKLSHTAAIMHLQGLHTWKRIVRMSKKSNLCGRKFQDNIQRQQKRIKK